MSHPLCCGQTVPVQLLPVVRSPRLLSNCPRPITYCNPISAFASNCPRPTTSCRQISAFVKIHHHMNSPSPVWCVQIYDLFRARCCYSSITTRLSPWAPPLCNNKWMVLSQSDHTDRTISSTLLHNVASWTPNHTGWIVGSHTYIEHCFVPNTK